MKNVLILFIIFNVFASNSGTCQSLFQSGDYYSKLNAINLDYIPNSIRSNLKIGRGYDMSDMYFPVVADNSPFLISQSNNLTTTAIKPKLVNIKIASKDIDYNFEENVSEETIAKFFHADLKLKFPSIDIRGTLDYTRKQYSASKAVRFWLQSTETVESNEINANWNTEPVTEKSQISDKESLWKLFKGTYGTHYVTSLNLGYKIEMIAIATEANNESKLKISSAFRAWKAKGKFDAEISQQIKESKVDIFVKVFCGEIKNTTTGSNLPFIVTGIDDVLSFLDELKNNKVQITPAPISMNVKSYFASVCSKYTRSCLLFEAKPISNDNSLIPKGTIIAWHPSIDNKVVDATGNLKSLIIPDGWLICDGKNNTPNLDKFFLMGTLDPNIVNTTGGSETHTHTINGTTSAPSGAKNGADKSNDFEAMGTDHTHTFGGTTSDVSTIPPFNRVLYLIKI